MEVLRGLLPRPACGGTVVLAALWLAAGLTARVQAEMHAAQEYQLKAAFLYNFAKFVDWPPPAGANDPLVIVVFGQDPFGPALENTVWGKSIGNRPLVVRRTNRVQEVMPCHVLFVSTREQRRVSEVLRAVEGTPVLTVSEADDFLALGGAVRFLLEDSRLRFEIDLGAARRSGLNISSRLLRLARVVKN